MKKILSLIVVFVVILAAYVAAHAGIYFSLVDFFGISSPHADLLLREALVFLGGSFLFATFLSHFKDNIFTRVCYFLAASWLGIMMNLILFFVLAWLALFASRGLHIAADEKIIGFLAVFYALAYSVYGAWNAFNPRIKRLEIALDNLPSIWKGKKIVQIADVHLGNIYTERYAHDLVDQINALSPDVIVISGDLFDGTNERLNTFIAPLNRLKAKKGVYYVTGNHETYLEEHHMSIVSKTKIIQLHDEMRDLDGLQIVGIEYPTHFESKDIGKVIENLSDFNPKKPSILLWHTPTQIEGAKKAGISLQLSGHTHKGQLFPCGLITKLVYGKYDYGFRREGSYAIYTSSGVGGWGPPMRTEKSSEIVEITLL